MLSVKGIIDKVASRKLAVTVNTSAKEKPPSHPSGWWGRFVWVYAAAMLVRRRLRRSQRQVAVGTIIQP